MTETEIENKETKRLRAARGRLEGEPLPESPPAAPPPSPKPPQCSLPWEGSSPPLDLGFLAVSISLNLLDYLDPYKLSYMIMDTDVTPLTIVVQEESCYAFTIVLELL
jgi:hypothetical protein